MLLDLCGIRGSERRVDCSLEPSVFSTRPGDEYRVSGPVALQLRLHKDGDKYRLEGGLKGQISMACSRCLEEYRVSVDLSVDLMYLPYSSNSGEGESEVSDEDLSTAFYIEDQIDLGQMVREQFQLSVPMKPLCEESCRGLCSVCGINLNRHRCDCDSHWHDPRLDKLEKLLLGRRKA